MSNIRMIINDGWRGAVLSATSGEVGLEIENSQNEKRAYPWRSTSDAAQTLTAVMPVSVMGMGGLVLNNTNLTAGATAVADLKSGVATVAPGVALECLGVNFDGTTSWVAWFSVETAVDQVELVITDTDNPDEYIQVVQVMCGPVVSPEYNFEFGAEMAYIEDIRHMVTAGQSLRSEGTGAVRREFALDLGLLPESDRETLVSELLRGGMRDPLFVSLYPGLGGDLEHRHQFVAKRTTEINQSHWAAQFWEQSITFREV